MGFSRSIAPPSRSAGRASAPQADDPWQEYRERIALAPEAGTVRGLFFRDVFRMAPKLAVGRPRYIPFSSYPLREYMTLLVEGAGTAHPGATPSEALRCMGHSVYEAFASSLAGSALFGIIQHEYVRILELTPKAYPLTMEPGEVEVQFKSDIQAVVQLRDVWPFPEVFHLGIWEGAYRALGVVGSVEVVPLTRSAVDLHLRWDPATIRGAPYSRR